MRKMFTEMPEKRGGMILARSGMGKIFCTKNHQFAQCGWFLLRQFTAQANPTILFTGNTQLDAPCVVLA